MVADDRAVMQGKYQTGGEVPQWSPFVPQRL
jgi:hypothetical protein